jgi:ATP-dependent helicase/nuclease subunit B
MALQFILGSSGSGKTEYIYRQIVAEAGEQIKKNYLVIVPEQFTMQTQQKLVELSPNHAIMNIDVLSFKRLAYRVFDELGKTDIPVLEETGKNLVLRRLAQEQEEKLTVLRPNLSRMGYIGEVKSLLSELVQYNVSPAQLLAVAGQPGISSVLSAKLHDIVTMYQAFLDFMQGSYVTAEEILHVLKTLAPQSQILRDSVVVFDEFTGFTPIQNDLLREILPLVDRMYVTLTMDAREDFYHSTGSEELFYLSKKTIATLTAMAQETRVEVAEPVVLDKSAEKRFANAPALAFMEQNLFRPKRAALEEKPEEIRLFLASNPRDELTMVAREINRLIREGARYREIAVVTGAVESYRSYIGPVFEKYRIPYFLDATTDVLFHPFIETIRALLEIVESNFSYDAIMRFLRCGFCEIEEDELDRLDNYLVATGIRGKAAWSRQWVRLPRETALYDLEKLEQIRIMLSEILLPLYDTFAKKESRVSDGILALYQVLVKLGAEHKLWEREQELLAQGQQTKSKEYGQIYAIVMQLLEKYNALLGEEPLQIADFTEVLEAGLSAASLATIPPGYDSVTIGDIERTRLNHIRILFFIGVNDGVIPKSANAGGIISEYERELLLEADMDLAPGAREQAFIQRFYLYRNLTKPSEKLYISYSRVDTEGKAIRPSYLIGVLAKLFPALDCSECENVNEDPHFYTEAAAPDYLIHGKRDASWYALAGWFARGDASRQAVLQRILDASYAVYTGEPISRAVALALYGRKPTGSVTRLERYAACAYAHFLQYGLQLREREVSGFENVDMGNLYHMALERYSHKLEQSDYDWFTVPQERREAFAEAAMLESLEEYPHSGADGSEEHAYQVKRMQTIFAQTIWALTKQVRAGKFVPQKYEVSFRELGDCESLQFSLEHDVQFNLTGRIDRIDSYDDGNQISIKVIDYKSGNTKFDLIRLYQGLQLQLVVYLDASMELTEKEHPDRSVTPGGILYYHIDDPVLESEEELTQTDAEHALLLALRPDGMVNADEAIYRAMDADFETKSEMIPVELKKTGEPTARSRVATTEEFALIQSYTRMKIKESSRAIYDGDVRVDPYRSGMDSSCNFCPYASVCGIDGKIPGFAFRHPEAPGKDEIFEQMKMAVLRS